MEIREQILGVRPLFPLWDLMVKLCYQVHAANGFYLLSHVTSLTLLFKTLYNSRPLHVKLDHHKEYCVQKVLIKQLC